MDLNQIMQLASNPQVQQLLKGLLGQFTKGGGQANMAGLVDQLQKGGLGDQVNSWMQQGPNQPVTAAQITDALGTGTVDQLASAAGLPPETAAEDLAQVLPEMVNAATPGGQLPAAPQADAPQLDVDALLKQLLGGLTPPKQ